MFERRAVVIHNADANDYDGNVKAKGVATVSYLTGESRALFSAPLSRIRLPLEPESYSYATRQLHALTRMFGFGGRAQLSRKFTIST